MDSDEDNTEVQFESLEEIKEFDQSSVNINKGKYYKQTYRVAWEQMPDFKGWLRGMPGEPTRAFCMYCQKSLHAHRLSLLKHTCTIRHQKAAQLNFIRQQQQKGITSDNKKDEETMESLQHIVLAGSSQDESGEDQQEVSYEAIAEEDVDLDEQEEAEEAIELEDLQVQLHKVRQQNRSEIMANKPVISTHVLDTCRGQAVAGLQVCLYKLIDGRWTYINEGLTNQDGRFSNFLSRDDFTAGRYKLHFDVDRYFELRKQDSLYPFIEIVFDCRAPVDHYHIPLLLGPFGYTTYRGS